MTRPLQHDMSFEEIFMSLVVISEEGWGDFNIMNFTGACRKLPAARVMVGKVRSFIREHGEGKDITVDQGFISHTLLEEPDEMVSSFRKVILDVGGEREEVVV